jgi:hypothetical protein
MSERSDIAWDRLPVILTFAERVQMVETYGFSGSQGKTTLEGQLLRPRDIESKRLFAFMYPSSTLHLLPMPDGAGVVRYACALRRQPLCQE